MRKDILETCCQVLGCTPEEIRSPSRKEPLVLYRHIIAKELTRNGRFRAREAGVTINRDRTTVMWSIAKYRELAQTHPAFRVWAAACKAAVQAAIFQPIDIEL